MRRSVVDEVFAAHGAPAPTAACADDGISPTADGSGIVLVQIYKGRPAVLLVRSRQRTLSLGEYGSVKIYELPGGGCDSSNDAPSLTAKRELLEESANFFFLRTSTVLAAPKETVGRYRVYVAMLDDAAGAIRAANHAHNVSTIADYHKKHGGVPHPWREMDKMVRVFVDDLEASGLPCRDVGRSALPLLVRDSDGAPIMIYPRDASALKKHWHNLTTGLQALRPVVLRPPVRASKADAKRWRKPFLEDTWQHSEV